MRNGYGAWRIASEVAKGGLVGHAFAPKTKGNRSASAMVTSADPVEDFLAIDPVGEVRAAAHRRPPGRRTALRDDRRSLCSTSASA